MVGIPAANWGLMMTDPPFDFIIGQFEPQSLEVNISGEWQYVSALGQNEPFPRFLHGNPTQIRFNVTFHDNSFLQSDVMDKVGDLEGFVRKNETIGRPPNLLLMIGQDLVFENVHLKTEAISFGKLTTFGSVDLASIALEFGLDLEPYKGPSSPATAGLTQYYVAQTFESYEAIALKKYGNPLRGVYLSQLNRDVMEVRHGDLITVPEKSTALKVSIQPSSIQMNQDDPEVLALRVRKFEARSGSRRTYILSQSQ